MKCLRIYATPDGESHFGDADIPTTTMPLFPNEAAFQLCVSVSCMFQQVFAKRAGISRPDECSQYGLTASWNLRRAMGKCAEFQLGMRCWWRIYMERGTSRGIP